VCAAFEYHILRTHIHTHTHTHTHTAQGAAVSTKRKKISKKCRQRCLNGSFEYDFLFPFSLFTIYKKLIRSVSSYLNMIKKDQFVIVVIVSFVFVAKLFTHFAYMRRDFESVFSLDTFVETIEILNQKSIFEKNFFKTPGGKSKLRKLTASNLQYNKSKIILIIGGGGNIGSYLSHRLLNYPKQSILVYDFLEKKHDLIQKFDLIDHIENSMKENVLEITKRRYPNLVGVINDDIRNQSSFMQNIRQYLEYLDGVVYLAGLKLIITIFNKFILFYYYTFCSIRFISISAT